MEVQWRTSPRHGRPPLHRGSVVLCGDVYQAIVALVVRSTPVYPVLYIRDVDVVHIEVTEGHPCSDALAAFQLGYYVAVSGVAWF